MSLKDDKAIRGQSWGQLNPIKEFSMTIQQQLYSKEVQLIIQTIILMVSQHTKEIQDFRFYFTWKSCQW